MNDPKYEEFLKSNKIPQSQKVSLSICLKTLQESKNFESQSIDFFHDFVILFGKLNDKASALLPIYHDWELESQIINDFSSSFPEKSKIIAMAAPDGSCIFYECKQFDTSSIDSDDDCQDPS